MDLICTTGISLANIKIRQSGQPLLTGSVGITEIVIDATCCLLL